MVEITKEEEKEIKKTIGEIEKAFGKGSIMLLGDEPDKKIDSIPSGSLLLDKALGVGGYPKGRIIEIFGPESSGKTTLSLHAIAEAQKKGGIVAFIDAEHALDVNYASKLGVDIDNLLLSQPDTGEQALEIVEQLIKSKLISMIVIDSVAALVPEAEIMGDMGDSHMGLQARLMSQAMRKLSGIINKTNTTVIFINQVREKIGVVYGNPETTPGGRALKFYSSVRLDVRKQEILKNQDEFIGTKVAIKVVKNKVAPPFKNCVVEILFGKGISKILEIIDLSVEYNIIQKSGSWYSYNEIKIGQGKEQVKNFLTQNTDIYNEIESKILEIIS